ncbi:MAG: hypothetical protein ABFC71_09650 [Methanoregula sp.]
MSKNSPCNNSGYLSHRADRENPERQTIIVHNNEHMLKTTNNPITPSPPAPETGPVS